MTTITRLLPSRETVRGQRLSNTLNFKNIKSEKKYMVEEMKCRDETHMNHSVRIEQLLSK